MPDSLRPMRPIKRVPFVEEVLPVLDPEKAHSHTKPKPAAPHKPCAGFGLNTPANEKQFAQGFKRLQQAWPKLSDVQRRSQIEELANAELQKSGVPKVQMVPSILLTEDGEFDFSTWTLAINKKLLNKNSLSEPQAKNLANTVYHESRHAEQFYLIAQQKAAELGGAAGGTPAQQAQAIYQATRVSTKAAVQAQQHPLNAHDTRKPCAEALNASLYKHTAYHNKVIDDTSKTILALNHAEAHYENVNRHYEALRVSPHASPAVVQKAYETAVAAEKQVEAASAVQQKAYQAYRQLPEEADAWETADAMGKY